MMEMLALRCPSCGGSLKVDAAAVRGWCPFCNTEFLIETALRMQAPGSTVDSQLANMEQLMKFGEWMKAQKAGQRLCDTAAGDYRCWYYQARAISQEGTAILSDTGHRTSPGPVDLQEVAGGRFVPDPRAMECLRRAQTLVPEALAEDLIRFRQTYLDRVRQKNLTDCEAMIRKHREVIAADRSDTPEYREAKQQAERLRKEWNDLYRRKNRLTDGLREYTAEWRYSSLGLLAFTVLLFWATRRSSGLPAFKLICLLATVLVSLYAWLGLYWRESAENRLGEIHREMDRQRALAEQCEQSGRKAAQAAAALELTEKRLKALQEDPSLYASWEV